MVKERKIIPRTRFRIEVWLTGKITKVTFPGPPLFIHDSVGFVHTPVNVILLPPRWVPRFEVGWRGILFLLPLLIDGWDGESVQSGPLCIPEGLRGWGGCRSCSWLRGGRWSTGSGSLVAGSLKLWYTQSQKYDALTPKSVLHALLKLWCKNPKTMMQKELYWLKSSTPSNMKKQTQLIKGDIMLLTTHPLDLQKWRVSQRGYQELWQT